MLQKQWNALLGKRCVSSSERLRGFELAFEEVKIMDNGNDKSRKQQ
jgi:hypothetical protein